MDNSQAGSINETYDLFLRHGLHLVGETVVRVDHCLLAAGAIEAVFCILALQNQFLPPNINFGRCYQDVDLNIVANQSYSAPVRTIVSNSFGFGGANASIVIQQMPG